MILSIILIIIGTLIVYDGGKTVCYFTTIITAGFFPHNNVYRSIVCDIEKNIIIQGFGELSFGIFLFLRSLNVLKAGSLMEADTLTLISNVSLILVCGGIIIAVILHLTSSLRSMNDEMEKEYHHKQELGVNSIKETVFTFSYQAMNQKLVFSTILLVSLIVIRLI